MFPLIVKLLIHLELSNLFILDYDECAANEDDCNTNTVCVNMGGGFRCDCLDGFKKIAEERAAPCVGEY